MKYKVVAAINLFLGIIQAIILVVFLVFTLPKLMSLYSEFNAKQPSYSLTYLGLGIVLLIALASLFTGFKLISKTKENKDKYFYAGIILIVVTFVLSGLFTGIGSLSAILPIYNLTSKVRLPAPKHDQQQRFTHGNKTKTGSGQDSGDYREIRRD